METHMITWGIRFEEQYGFTEGGRIEQCLFTVNYITNRTFESQKAKHKYLYLAMIDFSKSYDSVDRRKLIETMREYRINIRIIEMIVQMYSKDNTTIKLGGLQEKVRVTSGIRQGCCISTLLFKMVTFKIIEKLRSKGVKYQVDRYNGNSIWLADDSTLIAGSKKSMQTNIRILKKKAQEYGLKMNDSKSKIIQVRGTEKARRIEGLEVVETVKYLGVTLGGVGRDVFREERNNVVERAQKKALALHSYVKKSYDVASVGKTLWKQQAVPGIMFGKQVVTLNKNIREKLQVIENNVYRRLIGVGQSTPVEALRES